MVRTTVYSMRPSPRGPCSADASYGTYCSTRMNLYIYLWGEAVTVNPASSSGLRLRRRLKY